MHELLKNNTDWAQECSRTDAQYFNKLHAQSSPEYLWIGCSCQDLPAHQLVGVSPSQILVHNNLGNLILDTDMSLLACLHHALFDLNIRQIIVCGHRQCHALSAALDGTASGLAESWLRKLHQVYEQNQTDFDPLDSTEERLEQLSVVNVAYQVSQLELNPVVRDARKYGRSVQIHAWVYEPTSGILSEVETSPA